MYLTRKSLAMGLWQILVILIEIMEINLSINFHNKTQKDQQIKSTWENSSSTGQFSQVENFVNLWSKSTTGWGQVESTCSHAYRLSTSGVSTWAGSQVEPQPVSTHTAISLNDQWISDRWKNDRGCYRWQQTAYTHSSTNTHMQARTYTDTQRHEHSIKSHMNIYMHASTPKAIE